MDLTIHQLKEGNREDLEAIKKEIICYLDNKRHTTKSARLINTLEQINKVLLSRNDKKENKLEKRAKKEKKFKDKDELPYMSLSYSEIPMFLQDNSYYAIRRKKIESEVLFVDKDQLVPDRLLGSKTTLSEDFGHDELYECSRDLYGNKCHLSESTSLFDYQSTYDLNLEEDNFNSYIYFC